MHKLLATLVAVVMALAACSSDVSLTAESGDESGPGTTDAATTDEDASGDDAGTDDGVSDDGVSGDDGSGSDDGSSDRPEFTGEGAEQWCALMEELDELFDEAFGMSPDSMVAAFEEVVGMRRDLLAVTPAEIRDDLELVFDWIADDYIPALRAADGDWMAVDESLLFTPELERASDNLEDYEFRFCGDPYDGDDEIPGVGMMSEDMMSNLFDGDFDEAEFMKELFVMMGLSEQDAECLLDGVAVEEFEDENFLFERLGDCGLTIMDLAGG